MGIIILDTECSNLLSIHLSIKKLGFYPIISKDPKIICNAKKLILPGVGSASSIMKTICNNELIKILQNIKCPTLGICLGMQLLSSFSEESGGVEMMGMIDIPVSLLNTRQLPLPHTGWNQIIFDKYHTLFKKIPSGSWFYFIHSYAFPINRYMIAKSLYNVYFSSVIHKNNFFGVQFHPEKSGTMGLQLLLNFLEM